MQPDFQHHWLHSVPIDKSVTEGRINLTFRKVIEDLNDLSGDTDGNFSRGVTVYR
jgi:hypothetical protein